MLKPIKTRELSQYEESILAKMLEYDFVDNQSIKLQISKAAVVVDGDDEYGSVTLTTESTAQYEGSNRVPIELEAKDSDGVPIAALLHVVDGYIQELEFYKADGSKIIRMPEIEHFERKIW